MKKFLNLILILSFLFGLSFNPVYLEASPRRPRATQKSSKTIHVKSYKRKDGTVVRAHTRRPPGSRISTPKYHSSNGDRTPSNKLKRSTAARDQFRRQSGHPGGWKGHVVDHIIPLACGGADDPSNMQWQTTEVAKAKDKVERKGCGK